MKSQVRQTVWCHISGEAAGEIWNDHLFGSEKIKEYAQFNAI